MRTTMTAIAIVIITASAWADSFRLVDSETGAIIGPVEYKDGAIVQIGEKKYTLLQVKSPLEAKMKSIVIPEIDFREAHLVDVIKFLADASVEYGPDTNGVNMVINSSEPSVVGRDAVKRFTISAKQLSLFDAVRYATEMLGLGYRIDDNAVVIFDKGAATGQQPARGDSSKAADSLTRTPQK